MSFSAWVTWCLSRRLLRDHLSLSDRTVESVGNCAFICKERSLGKKVAFLSAGDSQYPHSMAGRLRVGSGISQEILSDTPFGYILRNWKIKTLQKAWPQ